MTKEELEITLQETIKNDQTLLDAETANSDFLADKLRKAIELLGECLNEIKFFASEASLKPDKVFLDQITDFLDEMGPRA